MERRRSGIDGSLAVQLLKDEQAAYIDHRSIIKKDCTFFQRINRWT
jgi:hypothetical protein